MSRATDFIILSGLLALSGIACAGDIRVTGQFVSEASSGPPLIVNSSDKVTGLNVDRLDGMTSADFATVNELATPDSGTSVHYKNISGIPGVEINQDCAINTGCGSADSPGFPVTINQRGSYRLSGNLETTNEDTTLIEILVSSVTLDLQGFSLQGPVTCGFSGANLNCSPSEGTGTGIHVPGGLFNISIVNGSIQGMGSYGLNCVYPSSCRAMNISVALNGGTGMYLARGLVIDSVAFKNFGHGISVIQGVVRSSSANGNKDIGVRTRHGSVIDNCSSFENGASGFYLNGFATAKNSVATENSGSGFKCSKCTILDSIAAYNDEYGLESVGSPSAMGKTRAYLNSLGSTAGTWSDMSDNFCEGGC